MFYNLHLFFYSKFFYSKNFYILIFYNKLSIIDFCIIIYTISLQDFHSALKYRIIKNFCNDATIIYHGLFYL